MQHVMKRANAAYPVHSGDRAQRAAVHAREVAAHDQFAIGPSMETSHKSLGSYKFTDGWHLFEQMKILALGSTPRSSLRYQPLHSLQFALDLHTPGVLA